MVNKIAIGNCVLLNEIVGGGIGKHDMSIQEEN
jgi:hypothetical protein